jgi:hypothetical protein
MWPSLVKIQYTELKLSCGNDPVVKIFRAYFVMHTFLVFTFLLEAGRWFSPGTPVSSTNKTDRHDITEILLKVALKLKVCCLFIFSGDTLTFNNILFEVISGFIFSTDLSAK